MLEFDSWTQDEAKLDYDHLDKSNRIDTSYYLSMPEWSLVGTGVTKSFRYYACCPGPFVKMIFSLKLRRQPQFFVVQCILPVVTIASLSCFIFFLPPNNEERVSFGTLLMLGNTVTSAMIADTMPSSSDTVPMICLYLITIFWLDVVSLIVNILIIKIQANKHPVPRWVRIIVLKGLAVLVCLRWKTESYSPSELYMVSNAHIFTPQHSRIKRPEHDKDNRREPNEYDADIPHAKSLLNEVKCITKKIYNTDTTNKTREEWMFVARVMDRLAIVVFVFCMATATLIMFLQAIHVFKEE